MTNARDAELVPYDSVNDFSKAALPFLLAHEALNNLQLGVIRFLQQPGPVPAAFLATVRDRLGSERRGYPESRPRATGLRHSAALDGSTRERLRARRSIRLESSAHRTSRRRFAEAWCAHRGSRGETSRRERGLSLKALRAARAGRGPIRASLARGSSSGRRMDGRISRPDPEHRPPPAIELLEPGSATASFSSGSGKMPAPSRWSSQAVRHRTALRSSSCTRLPRSAAEGSPRARSPLYARRSSRGSRRASRGPRETTAIRVYEQLGFERIGVVEHYLFERGT